MQAYDRCRIKTDLVKSDVLQPSILGGSMRNIFYWVVMCLPIIFAILLAMVGMDLVVDFFRNLKVLEGVGDEKSTIFWIKLGFYALLGIPAYFFYTSSFWDNFVHTRFYPLEQDFGADFDGWTYFAPKSAAIFSVKHFPMHSDEGFSREDLKDSWCVLANSFYCILTSSDRFRFSTFPDDDQDDEGNLVISERSLEWDGSILVSVSSSNQRSNTDLVLSGALNVEGVLPKGLQQKIIETLSSEFAAESGGTLVGIDHSRSEVSVETINYQRVVASSIVLSVAMSETEQTEWHIFDLHIFSANTVKTLSVGRLGNVSEDLCEFSENFLRGMSVENLGYLWQCSACSEGFLKKTPADIKEG